MEAEFSAEWEGLAITATFEAGDEKRDKIYTGEPIVIPHEVLSTAGVSVLLGFQGAMPDGTIVKRTEKEWLNNVSETLDPAGVQSSEPTPDWTAQVQNIATEAKQVADSVRSDADAGKFNGLAGPKGDTGATGATGPKGDTGATGPQGPQGIQGETGPQGPKGDKGDKGDAGEKGQTGPAGTDGGWYAPDITQPDESTLRFAFTPSKEGMPAVPPKDITIPGGGGSGEAGGYYAPAVDAAGNLSWTASKADMPAVDGANIKGPKGDTGATGATGAKGETGATGAQGPQGPKGDKGDKGDTGATGPKGQQGVSGVYVGSGAMPEGYNVQIDPDGAASDIIIYIGANGNWYIGDTDTGKPSRGEMGPQGPQGIKGDTGPQGIQGPAGPQGPKGDPGDTGPAGPKGDTGATGPAGPKGDPGDVGPAGPKGDTGPAGPKGDTGATGPKGDTGPAGQSAYAAAQAGGYTDTEANFYADLAAMQGLASALAAI